MGGWVRVVAVGLVLVRVWAGPSPAAAACEGAGVSCGAHAECKSHCEGQGRCTSFSCVCVAGYVGDGRVCVAEGGEDEVPIPAEVRLHRLRLVDRSAGVDTTVGLAVWMHAKPLMRQQVEIQHGAGEDGMDEVIGDYSMSCPDDRPSLTLRAQGLHPRHYDADRVVGDLFPHELVRDPFARSPASPTLPSLGMHALYDGLSQEGEVHLYGVGGCASGAAGCPLRTPSNSSALLKSLSACRLLFSPDLDSMPEPSPPAQPHNASITKQNADRPTAGTRPAVSPELAKARARSLKRGRVVLHRPTPVAPWLRPFHVAHRIHHIFQRFDRGHHEARARTESKNERGQSPTAADTTLLPIGVPATKGVRPTVPSHVLKTGFEGFNKQLKQAAFDLASRTADDYQAEEDAKMGSISSHDDLADPDADRGDFPAARHNKFVLSDDDMDDVLDKMGQSDHGVGGEDAPNAALTLAHGFLKGVGDLVEDKAPAEGRHKDAIHRLAAFAKDAGKVAEERIMEGDDLQASFLQVNEGAAATMPCHGSNPNRHRHCDIGGTTALAAKACMLRVRSDIKDQLLLDLQTATQTQAASIIKAVMPPLLMALLTPLIGILLSLALPFIVGFLIAPISEAVRPTVIIACMGIADTKMGQAIEATLYQLLSEGMKGILRRSLSWCIPRAMKKTLPRAITFYVLNFESIQLAKPIAHGVVHTVTQSFTQQAGGVLPKAITNSVTHMMLARLQRYEYCIYCYYHGQYCDECDQYQYTESSAH